MSKKNFVNCISIVVCLLGATTSLAADSGNVILFTGQQTVQALERVKELNGTSHYLSSPPFNEKKTGYAGFSALQGVNRVNDLCFGNIMVEAAKEIEESHNVKYEWEVEEFVKKKSKERAPLLVNTLEKRGHYNLAERIDEFANNIEKKKIKSENDWIVFLKENNLPVSLELDLKKYLTNFDKSLSEEELAVINSTEVLDKSGELRKIGDDVVRWFTKAFFKPKGCFTDWVNLKSMFENGMPLPDIYVMDAEVDDCAVLMELEKRHSKKGTSLKVIVQLPASGVKDSVVEHYRAKKYEILFDAEATNVKAVNLAHPNLQ